MGIPFLTMKLYTSIWMGIFFILSGVFEIGFLLKYVTRFAEEIFSVLISLIFFSETTKFVYRVSMLDFFIRDLLCIVLFNMFLCLKSSILIKYSTGWAIDLLNITFL